MPSQFDVLKRAAERIRGRALTPAESRALDDLFRKEKGTDAQRAKEALRKSLGWSPEEFARERQVSDNTDRVVNDLEDHLRPKRP